MKIKRFQESLSDDDKDRELDFKMLKAVYNDIKDDVKDSLDEIFIYFIDKDFDTELFSDVNSSSIKTTYRIKIVIDTDNKDPDLHDNEEVNFSNQMANITKAISTSNEYVQQLENCVEHLKYQYEDVSIFGEDFPLIDFTYQIVTQMANSNFINSDKILISFTLVYFFGKKIPWH